MTSRAVLVASVALLVVLAGCLSVGGAGSDGTTAGTSNSTIDVAGTASVSASPDLALVGVAVVATAETADEAREVAAENVAAMRDALDDAGVDDDQVHTTAYYLRAVYDYENGDREIVHYRVEHAFEIETDVDRAGDVVDVAVTNGANQVSGVQFTLTDDTRRDLRTQALALAMANAREDADAIAKAGDLTIVGVKSAKTSGVGYVPFDSRFEGDGAAGGSTVIEPGPVRVSVTVAVTYRAA